MRSILLAVLAYLVTGWAASLLAQEPVVQENSSSTRYFVTPDGFLVDTQLKQVREISKIWNSAKSLDDFLDTKLPPGESVYTTKIAGKKLLVIDIEKVDKKLNIEVAPGGSIYYYSLLPTDNPPPSYRVINPYRFRTGN